jgi:hypothetical protein
LGELMDSSPNYQVPRWGFGILGESHLNVLFLPCLGIIRAEDIETSTSTLWLLKRSTIFRSCSCHVC